MSENTIREAVRQHREACVALGIKAGLATAGADQVRQELAEADETLLAALSSLETSGEEGRPDAWMTTDSVRKHFTESRATAEAWEKSGHVVWPLYALSSVPARRDFMCPQNPSGSRESSMPGRASRDVAPAKGDD